MNSKYVPVNSPPNVNAPPPTEDIVEIATMLAKGMEANPEIGHAMGGNKDILIVMVRWPK